MVASIPPATTDPDRDPFWIKNRADFLAARSTAADQSACGTCRTKADADEPVEHDECQQRATLLHAPDHPYYEILAGFSLEENATLPARFHVPVFDDCGVPNAWLCAVCQEEGVVTAWPCATATKYGAQVFTPLHEAETAQKKQAARIAELEQTRQEASAAHASETVLQRQIDSQAEEIDRLRAALGESNVPSRFRATPAEVDVYLRRILTEQTLLGYQRAIGNRAAEEAAKDIRMETASLKAHGVLEPDKDWAASSAADHIDPLKGGGHYPSVLLCSKHNGFGPCPGAPRCTPRDDDTTGGQS